MMHMDVLQQIYDAAVEKAIEKANTFENLGNDVKNNVEYIVSRSENNKGMLTVLVTLLTHKIVDPMQDIRLHQAGMENGFAGRVIDHTYITPFMKSVSFPAMAESGWKTHSFSQARPYDLQYTGVFTPREAKDKFLHIVDQIQTKGTNPAGVLLYLFVLLIKKRDDLRVELAKPHSLSIMDNADWSGINDEIQRISKIHGCQVIVNGVYSTLKYYLRLLNDPVEFVDSYVEAMKTDETIKYQHKTMWNDVVSGKL